MLIRSGHSVITATLALVATIGPIARAQQEPTKAPPTSVRYGTWSAEVSRRLFSLCDGNRDDRLTFREVRKSLHINTPAGFRPFDRDQDGRLHQGEFDLLYRDRVNSGRGLVIHGRAAAGAPEPPIKVAVQIRQLFEQLDRDKDQFIVPAEWQTKENPLHTAAPQCYLRLDLNRDNRLELKEMKGLEKLIPGLVQRREATPVIDPNVLSARYQKVDQDGDNRISPRELELLLKAIDPSLPRWTPAIFRRLDRNRNGSISPREIRLVEAEADREGRKVRTGPPPAVPGKS